MGVQAVENAKDPEVRARNQRLIESWQNALPTLFPAIKARSLPIAVDCCISRCAHASGLLLSTWASATQEGSHTDPSQWTLGDFPPGSIIFKCYRPPCM